MPKRKLPKTPIIGERFGKLIVLRDSGIRKNKNILWECLCDCGKTTLGVTSTLNRGNKRSCGCLHREQLIERCLTHGNSRFGKHSSEFDTWQNIKARCYNKKNNHFKNYGGRGIKVCDRWLNSFEAFLQDMGRKPSENHSIDRFPNTDGDYEPNNCRWATIWQQARNTTKNKWITYKGDTKILSDWATLFNVNPSQISYFMNKDLPIEYIFTYFKSKKYAAKKKNRHLFSSLSASRP